MFRKANIKNGIISLIAAACILCFCIFYSGCSCVLFYKSTCIDGIYDIGYKKKFGKDAFIAGITWFGDYEKTEFTVPDEYKGIKITALGGYIGRGYPMHFGIRIESDEIAYDALGGEDYLTDDGDYAVLKFTVNLGKNIKKIELVEGKLCLLKEIKNENGENTGYDATHKIVYYFNVAEDNSAFYSQDGKLYRKDGDKLVEDFFYE